MREISIVLIVVALVLGGGGWVFSNEIQTGVMDIQEWEFPRNVEVKDVAAREISLVNVDVGETRLDRDEIAGVVWDGGYGQITGYHGRDNGVVRRDFRIIEGLAPKVGDRVAIDEYAYPGDPSTFNMEFTDEMIPGPLGDLPTWVIPGSGDDWIVLVHGRQDRGRVEMLKLVPFLNAAGYTVVIPTYRNDEGAPQTEHRRVGFGTTEWEDLGAVMAWVDARASGDVSVIGYSMGGAITLSWMVNEPSAAAHLRAVILDSPAVDIARTIELQATQRNLPIPWVNWKVPMVLAKSALFISELRFGFDFGDANYIEKAQELPDVPILVLHGTEDVTIPIETSRSFADAAIRARVVELFGAHTRMWNVDREIYESEVLDFLNRYE